MRERHVVCPACGTQLLLPPDCPSRVARCGRCQTRFGLPARIAVTEDAVADWLSGGRVDRDAEEAAAPQKPIIEPPKSGQTSELSAMTENIHVARIDGNGVLLEFPAHRLMEMSFRTAIPRRCLKCGSRAHLRIHLIVFGSQLRDCIALEGEHEAVVPRLSEDKLRQMSIEEIINQLPKVSNVPHPAELPMPYWICDMCSGRGTVAGQIQVNPSTGEGLCRLRITNAHRAAEFLAAAGGYGTSEHHELMRKVAAMAESAWDILPEVVQHRIEQWYKPEAKEHFFTYVPDRRRTRPEDGMAGFIISSRRFIYHSQVMHKESAASEPVELELAMVSGKGELMVKTALWELRRINVDREGVDRMRRALVQGKFNAIWR